MIRVGITSGYVSICVPTSGQDVGKIIPDHISKERDGTGREGFFFTSRLFTGVSSTWTLGIHKTPVASPVWLGNGQEVTDSSRTRTWT